MITTFNEANLKNDGIQGWEGLQRKNGEEIEGILEP